MRGIRNTLSEVPQLEVSKYPNEAPDLYMEARIQESKRLLVTSVRPTEAEAVFGYPEHGEQFDHFQDQGLTRKPFPWSNPRMHKFD